MKQSEEYSVVWAPSDNIGDDIQTLAAIEFLKNKGIKNPNLINREDLKNYNGNPTNLIMNGWFMHKPNSFPPSNKINPIFISFHCDNRVEYNIINDRNLQYFKKHEPIGCRDHSTVNRLHQLGVKAFFTGCLTLLFNPHKGDRSGKYMVDINGNCPYMPKIDINKQNYPDYESINHLLDPKYQYDIDYRLSLAKSLLDKYSKAEHIYTSRLHCALPCRAFGTPCSFIHPKIEEDIRFGGLLEVLSGSKHFSNNSGYHKPPLIKIQSALRGYQY
jgi:hypothetical protein